VGDVVITTGSVRPDGASVDSSEYPAVAHFDCVSALVDAAHQAGITATSESLRRPTRSGPGAYDTVSGYVRRSLQGSRDEWAQLHVLNYEMESATLFTQCAANGWRAGMVAGVLVNRTQQEIPDASVHAGRIHAVEARSRPPRCSQRTEPVYKRSTHPPRDRAVSLAGRRSRLPSSPAALAGGLLRQPRVGRIGAAFAWSRGDTTRRRPRTRRRQG
jgi:hypothetical protein